MAQVARRLLGPGGNIFLCRKTAMTRKGKTKKELYDELIALHQRVAESKAASVEHQQTEQALRWHTERLQVIRDIEEAALADQSLEAIAKLALDALPGRSRCPL